MKIVMKLYDEYVKVMKLDTPFNKKTLLGQNNEVTELFVRCVIESENLTHTFSTEAKISKVTMPHPNTNVPVIDYPMNVLREEWVEDKSS